MGQQARTENHPLQPGDMTMTYADTEELRNYIGYVPDTDLDKGLQETVRWYQTLKLESAQ
jgi:UDP-glucuronate 4-epimerase